MPFWRETTNPSSASLGAISQEPIACADALTASRHTVELCGSPRGRTAWHSHGELLDRPFDSQPVPVDRLDMVAVGIANEHVVAVARKPGPDGAADCSGSDDDVIHAADPGTGEVGVNHARAADLRTDADGYPCRVAGLASIARLQTELDELFEDLWRGPWFTGQRTGFRPRVDLYVTGTRRAHDRGRLAGVDPADVSLVVAGDIARVSGHRGLEPGSECTASWYQVEIPRGHFERRVRLPANADAAAARASYSRGLLRSCSHSRHALRPGSLCQSRYRRDRASSHPTSGIVPEEDIEIPAALPGACRSRTRRLPAVDDSPRRRAGAVRQARQRRPVR